MRCLLALQWLFTNVLNPRAAIVCSCRQFQETLLQKGCSIGANVTVVCGVSIGEYAMVA